MAKIVIIDDNPKISKTIQRLLLRKGHSVYVASDGLNGYVLIKNILPDLVILDRNLPFASGDEIFEKIKEISSKFKIIILTGYDDEPSREKFTKLGAYMFISKGEGISTVIEKIESIVENENKSEVFISSSNEQEFKKTENKINILIVDDEKYVRDFLKKLLLKNGYNNVFEAENLTQTFEILKKQKINIILLDIILPDGNSFDIFEKINSSYHDLKVIVISGQEDEDLARKFLEKGAVDYLKKPISTENFISLIKLISLFFE